MTQLEIALDTAHEGSIAAGGSIVDDTAAPSFTVLAERQPGLRLRLAAPMRLS